MKTSFFKNITTNIKNLFQSRISFTDPIEPVLLGDLNLKKISLERSPLSEVFHKRNYLEILSETKNNNRKEAIAANFLCSNPINKETYSKLSSEELLAIRAQLTSDLVDDAETLIDTAKIIKKLFDINYGENNYTFISIGRSLSALAKCLDFMGVETKQIPLSACCGYTQNEHEIVDNMTNQYGFQKYKNFLETTLQEGTNKKHIFCDYANTGKTLKVFELLLNDPKVKLSTPNDTFIGINTALYNINNDNNKKFLASIKKFTRKLHRQDFDKYAEVKYLPYKVLEEFESALQPECIQLNSLLKFSMLDILKTT